VTAAARLSGWFSGLGKVASDALPVRLGGQSLPGTLAKPVGMAGFDKALVWVTVALMMWGLIMVYSATIAMPDNPKFARYAQTHFVTRHFFSLAVAFVMAVLAFQVLWRPGRNWRPGCLSARWCCSCWCWFPSLARASMARVAGFRWGS
jgi:cell division protein FtsW